MSRISNISWFSQSESATSNDVKSILVKTKSEPQKIAACVRTALSKFWSLNWMMRTNWCERRIRVDDSND